MLRTFDVKQAAFRLKLLAVWEGDEVEELAAEGDSEEEGVDDLEEGLTFPDDVHLGV